MKACAAGSVALLTGGIASGSQIIIPPRLAHDAAEITHRVQRASLRAEAQASYLTATEHRRLKGAQVAIRERADAEIAAYEQFKFEQQLALAEAAAPKTYIINATPPAAESVEGVPQSAAARKTSLRRSTYIPRSRGDIREPATVPRYFSRAYPNRFYRKQAQERGADQLIERIQRQDEINSRQQQLLNTPNGFIDVSNHRSGDIARDPYTGETFRVP
jgi:hypothetical protein